MHFQLLSSLHKLTECDDKFIYGNPSCDVKLALGIAYEESKRCEVSIVVVWQDPSELNIWRITWSDTHHAAVGASCTATASLLSRTLFSFFVLIGARNQSAASPAGISIKWTQCKPVIPRGGKKSDRDQNVIRGTKLIRPGLCEITLRNLILHACAFSLLLSSPSRQDYTFNRVWVFFLIKSLWRCNIYQKIQYNHFWFNHT